MYRLDDAEQAILGTLIDVADRQVAPASANVDAEGRFPSEAIVALGDAGLLGLTVPPRFGGMGKSPRVAAAVLEALAQALNTPVKLDWQTSIHARTSSVVLGAH